MNTELNLPTRFVLFIKILIFTRALHANLSTHTKKGKEHNKIKKLKQNKSRGKKKFNLKLD